MKHFLPVSSLAQRAFGSSLLPLHDHLLWSGRVQERENFIPQFLRRAASLGEKERSETISHLLAYLPNDCLIHHVAQPPAGQPDFQSLDAIVKEQAQNYQSIVPPLERRFSFRLVGPVTSVTQCAAYEPAVYDTLGAYLRNLRPLQLVGMEMAAKSLSSLLLGIALREKISTPEQAVRISTTEMRFQQSKWGATEASVENSARLEAICSLAAAVFEE